MEFGIWDTLPATMITAKVSPTALPIPKITAVMIPGNAAGNMIFLIVCQFVAPKPRDASLYTCGTLHNASNDTDMIVRRIIIASIIPAVKILKPLPPNYVLTNGTNTTSPKNP